jgi:deoxyribodipyrimidine photolyase-related protein
MPVLLLFPHQLYDRIFLPEEKCTIYLVEEQLFFIQYKFHKQKLVFHRASMKYYARQLELMDHVVHYIEATESRCDVRVLIEELSAEGIKSIEYFDTTDNWLERRIAGSCISYHIKSNKRASPLFLNNTDDVQQWVNEHGSYSLNDFYIWQRKKKNILVDAEQKPAGGKWTFDAGVKQRYPKNNIPPSLLFPAVDHFYEEAVKYVSQSFPSNPGDISNTFVYPYTHASALEWLNNFLEYRFAEYAIYEDAISSVHSVLHHSVLSPMLNTGLLHPQQVLNLSMKFALENDIPFNSLENFVHQIIGWREYIKIIYEREGTHQRNKNFFKFKRRMPSSFYGGTTRIIPFDKVMRKVISSGYCHHSERLMILGSLMLVCEIDPVDVHEFFTEMFIDSYDWVTVPNVYGLSQFSDGGLMCENPCINSSNYILKISDYQQGEWCEIWDALYWRFIHIHRGSFANNPGFTALVRSFDKIPEEKRNAHLSKAEVFLSRI